MLTKIHIKYLYTAGAMLFAYFAVAGTSPLLTFIWAWTSLSLFLVGSAIGLIAPVFLENAKMALFLGIFAGVLSLFYWVADSITIGRENVIQCHRCRG